LAKNEQGKTAKHLKFHSLRSFFRFLAQAYCRMVRQKAEKGA